jgi:hypothetical protein
MIFIRPVIVRSITDIPENAKYGKVVEMREQMMLAEDEKKPRKPAKNRSENRFKNRIK